MTAGTTCRVKKRKVKETNRSEYETARMKMDRAERRNNCPIAFKKGKKSVPSKTDILPVAKLRMKYHELDGLVLNINRTLPQGAVEWSEGTNKK